MILPPFQKQILIFCSRLSFLSFYFQAKLTFFAALKITAKKIARSPIVWIDTTSRLLGPKFSPSIEKCIFPLNEPMSHTV